MVADVAVLRAVMQALLRSVDEVTRTEVTRALGELAETSRVAGLTSLGAAAVDAALQRRLAAFETAFTQPHQHPAGLRRPTAAACSLAPTRAPTPCATPPHDLRDW